MNGFGTASGSSQRTETSVNILHLYDGHEAVYEGRGSVPNVVWNLARETARSGHNVEIIERQWADLPAHAVHEGVRFSRLGLRTGASTPWERVPYEMIGSLDGAAKLLVDRVNFALQAMRALRWRTVDVIHVHLPFAANVLVTVAPWLRDRTVYTAHIGETEARLREPRFSPDAYLADRVERTIVLNPTTRTAFESRGVDAERLTVVPNGVERDRFQDVAADRRGSVRESYGLHEGPIVLFAGTITPRKGVEALVDAAATVLETVDEDVQFVLVGNTEIEPAYTAAVRRAVDAHGIGSNVVLTGFVPDDEIPVFFDLADVFVLPSEEEGSSIAVTEAIASGTPVVGSRIDGIRQQIDDGVHGRLVAPGDIEALATALAEVLDDDGVRAAMADALGERAAELAWPTITERVLDVYREVDR